MSGENNPIVFVSTLEKFVSNLWHYHIPIPDSVALQLIDGENKRVVISLNQRVQWQAAIMKSDLYYFILVNEKNRAQLEIKIGDQVHVALEKDQSTYGHEMIEEFLVLLDQDEEFKHFFDALGKKRSLLYWAAQVKNSESRLKRALAIADQLKESQGKLDFKQINTRLKELNRK